MVNPRGGTGVTCGRLMTKEDYDNYKPKMCCSGIDCGCMGMPTEPPYCIKCFKNEDQENENFRI